MKWSEFKPNYIETPGWENTDIECPECAKYIKRNNYMVLTSIPPQYQYKCFECGWVGYK